MKLWISIVRLIKKLRAANRVRKQKGYYSLLWETSRFITTHIEQRANQSGMLRPYNNSSRPRYEFPAQLAGKQAERLGYNKVCLIEFGVAGGNGLIALEEIAEKLEQNLDVSFEIYGFDIGTGLPSPESYKDYPYFWDKDHYEMDIELLQSKLNRAELILGDVKDTVPDFVSEYNPAPIGALSIDLDYYSSTRDALKILEVGDDYISPRVPIYFDDVLLGDGLGMGIPQLGEGKAIEEYNENREKECIGKLQFRQDTNVPHPRKQYAYHRFNHAVYNEYIGERDRQNPLNI